MTWSRWVFVTAPGFVVSAVLLAWSIRGLLRTLSGATVASAPLAEVTRFELPAGGDYEIYLEGRIGTTDFRGVDMTLADGSGRAVRTDPIVFRTHVNSLSRARLSLRSFTAPAPGAYQLTFQGLRAGASPDNRVVISRPVRGSMVLHILAIVVCGILTIGTLIGSILLVVLPGRAAQAQ